MANLVMVPIDSIDVNPFRLTTVYPYLERKIEALQRSYADVGMWEGVIGRYNGNRVECAFGHHRVQAAKRSRMKEVPMIIRDLTDEQMLQFMGRENLEDYNADFRVMLETWEAGAKFLATARKTTEAIDIARLLGWTRIVHNDSVNINDTASACYAAHALISGGHLDRSDLIDISVSAAKQIVERAQSRMESLERMGRQTQRPREEIDRAKSHVGAAAKETAKEWRGGSVAHRDLRGRVDVHAFRESHKDPRPSPLFTVFGKGLADGIARMLKDDSASERLEEVCKAIPMVTFDDDKRIVDRLDFELTQLGQRTETWRKRITPTEKKVTRLRVTKEEQP